MKIVLHRKNVYNSDGATRSLIRLANELQNRGHEISILIHQKGIRETDKPFFEINKNIKIYNIYPNLRKNTSPGNIKNKFFSKKKTAEIIYFVKNIISAENRNTKKPRVLQKILSNRKLAEFYYSIWKYTEKKTIFRLKNIFKKLKPDIVIIFYTRDYYLSAEALAGTGIPFIRSNRNNPELLLNTQSFKYNFLENILSNTNANVVFNKKFINFFPEEIQKKTYVIENVVKSVQKKAAPGSNNAENTIITVGRLHKQKNHKLLIDAFAIIADKYPDWKINIFGDGYLGKVLRKQIDSYSLADRIILKGIKKDIENEYCESSIFAFPSIFEGWGLALTEAMAHGLPSVVLEECIPPAEIVDAGHAGLKAANNPADFAYKLEALIKSPALRKEMGDNAVNYIKNFDSKRVYDKWEKLITKVVYN